MLDRNTFASIALAAGLDEDAGEAEIIEMIKALRTEGGDDEIEDVLSGRVEGCTWDPAEERLTQVLDDPLVIGEVVIAELVYRPATAGDLRAAGKAGGKDASGLDTTFALLARLSNLRSLKHVDDLCTDDVMKFGGRLLPFLQASRRRRSRGPGRS